MADYFTPLKKRKTWRDHDPMEHLLKSWYGPDKGRNEILARLPESAHISEGMEEALKKLLPPSLATFNTIKTKWKEIAGETLIKFLTPSYMSDTVLYIEISHPAFLMDFRSSNKQLLLEKIQKEVGKSKCTDIKVFPAGSRRKYVPEKN